MLSLSLKAEFFLWNFSTDWFMSLYKCVLYSRDFRTSFVVLKYYYWKLRLEQMDLFLVWSVWSESSEINFNKVPSFPCADASERIIFEQTSQTDANCLPLNLSWGATFVFLCTFFWENICVNKVRKTNKSGTPNDALESL